MFKLKGQWKTYFHSLMGLAVGMVIIGFLLSLLRSRGPGFVQGPATTVGDMIFGQRFGF